MAKKKTAKKSGGRRAKRTKNKQSVKNIKRIDTPKAHGWQVHVRRGGKLTTKLFSDRKLGGKKKALDAAKQYRDGLVKDLAKFEKPLWRIKRTPRTNTGEMGVSLTHYVTNKGKKRKIITVTARSELGKVVSKKFSVEKLGYDKAVKQAVAWRRKVLRERLKVSVTSSTP